jgi:hypothetical protein
MIYRLPYEIKNEVTQRYRNLWTSCFSIQCLNQSQIKAEYVESSDLSLICSFQLIAAIIQLRVTSNFYGNIGFKMHRNVIGILEYSDVYLHL